MDYYPYLYNHIPFSELRGKKLLEVGLGYGTIAQKIAEVGADYQGLDIAEGPVAMVNHRLRQMGLPGKATQGSVLNCPFPQSSFDWVVAIGCFHHSGNLQRALDETWRVLKTNGQAMVMVYSAYSYRRWLRTFGSTLRYLLWDKMGIGPPPASTDRERAMYDTGGDGCSAPQTVFTSTSHLRRLCYNWSGVEITTENIGAEGLLRLIHRNTANRVLGPTLGLDIYCHLKK